MTLCNQFWLNWWVQFAVAVGTIATVLVALFGQAFRKKFFPPGLQIDFPSALGEKTRVMLQWMENAKTMSRMEDARYHHVRVRNSRRWSPATHVQVVLLRVEEPYASGAMIPVWYGDVPFIWRHQSQMPSSKTVGTDAFADVCSVVKGKWLQLHLLVAPNNLETVRRSACQFIVTVQVRSNEMDSPAIRLKISWDGSWHDGAEEMRRHLTVEKLQEAVA